VRSESLSSTIRIWAGAFTRKGSAEPARWHTGLARVFFDVLDLLLEVGNLGPDPLHLDDGPLAILADPCALIGIVAAYEVGRQAVDACLQRGYQVADVNLPESGGMTRVERLVSAKVGALTFETWWKKVRAKSSLEQLDEKYGPLVRKYERK